MNIPAFLVPKRLRDWVVAAHRFGEVSFFPAIFWRAPLPRHDPSPPLGCRFCAQAVNGFEITNKMASVLAGRCYQVVS